jgi:photosystem II stability/assembly factor-like uncharacterized protein
MLPAAAQEVPVPSELKHLKYRSIGPAAGGRVCRVSGVPGNLQIYYAATASGGVWKSTDGGINWKPIFDEQPVSSIGSIAVSPSNPTILYVGTGEANIRGNVAAGNGIYKSLNGGKTWQHVWNQPGQIGTMIVHPTNPDIAFAAVLGRAFGPNPERGVYRTTDGGKTWQRVLFKDPDTGASDVCFDPSNPNILFAGLWQARRRPWELIGGGPGSGLYQSQDGGETWKQLTGKGLPEGIWGKIGVAVSPADSRRVYALIEAEKGGLFRSDDGGDNWRLATSSHLLRQRAFYYSTITLDPKNADVIWCPNTPMLKSIDGGKTFQTVRAGHHGDYHDLWIDPQNSRRMINGNDGGVDLTTDGGESWYAPPLPISQFYHVAADNRTPYHVSGAMQDLGTAAGPSNSLSPAGIGRSDWYNVGGGEAGFTAPDPSDPDIVYATEYGGILTRYDYKTGQVRNITVYPFAAVGRGGEELGYRFQWTAPVVVSPHDSKVIYHASNILFKTSDAGMHWTAISPDLTRNDKSKEKFSGGPITGDNTGAEIYCTIFAVAESPRQKDLLWAGSDDGLVHVSRNGGKHWTNVTAKIPEMPEWGTVSCIEPSPFDAATAYLVVDAHRLDNARPYLYKTSDFGQSWKSLSAALPLDVYLHAVREDPKQRGMLYAGSERGVLFSRDDGATWQHLKLNLPTVPVHDLIVKDNDLVVGTHGRSIWILDDLTPIRTLTNQVAGKDLHLFKPLDTIRYRPRRSFSGAGAGENPPLGATINYYLKTKPKGTLTLDILDSRGGKVNQLSSKPDPDAAAEEQEGSRLRSRGTVLSTEPGVNRATWDLCYAGPTPLKGAISWPGVSRSGPMVNPGTYMLRLTVDGKTEERTVVVKADSRSPFLPSDLDEQLKLALSVRDQITHLSNLVKQLRSLKHQIESRNDLLKDNTKAELLVKLGKELVGKLELLEGKLHNPKAEVTYDLLAQRGGVKLYSQLSNVLSALTGSDGAPTQGVRDMYTQHEGELKQLDAQLNGLITGDLAKLNEMAEHLGIGGVIVNGNAKGGLKAEKQEAAAKQ